LDGPEIIIIIIIIIIIPDKDMTMTLRTIMKLKALGRNQIANFRLKQLTDEEMRSNTI